MDGFDRRKAEAETRGIDLEYGEQEARRRGAADELRVCRLDTCPRVERTHAGAFIAPARTCAMSSSAG